MDDNDLKKDLEIDPEFDKYSHTSTEDIETELQNHNAAFESLEREFQEVLTEMSGDVTLEKFRIEYEKLHRALKRSHEQEKRLVKKCRELNSEILNNQAKIKTALRLSQEDQKTIAHLQKEMEKTWKLVYMTQEKESRAKETIAQLKDEMGNLSKLVERGAGMSLNQENMIKDLKISKEELQTQLDETRSKLDNVQILLTDQHKQYEELMREKEESGKLLLDLRDRITQKETEIVRETKRLDKTQKELQDTKTKLEESLHREQQLTQDIHVGKNSNASLEQKLYDTKATLEKNKKDHEALFKQTEKVKEDLESQIARNKEAHNNYIELEKELKLKHIENRRLQTENDILDRKVDKEHRDVILLQSQVESAKIPLVLAQAEIETLKKELAAAHHKEVVLARETETVTREKEVQVKAKQRVEKQAKEQVEVKLEQDRNIKSLEQELFQSKIELGKLKTIVYQLENDRERISNDVAEQRNFFLKSEEEVRLKEAQVSELKKRVTDWENKLKQQQQMYEAVRTDRNHYSKNLLESQDEIAELKKKFKIMEHQIDQLKDEITSKDQALVKGHFDNQKSEKLVQTIQNELNAKNALVKQNTDVIKQLESELLRLTSMIKRLDEESFSQKKEYDSIVNERDILGIQLIRRNDELALLYEKIRIQSSALKAGETQYNARVDDIRMLRIKIKELIRQNTSMKTNTGNNDSYKNEILHLEKELLQEKTRVTALSEELENPMNVHRWRKLEGSDPATFELIQKIQLLQRRLISKTEEVVEKGLIIQEKDKLYNELKLILSRQPGPEIAEQLAIYQQNLKTKTKQMKAMASELNMFQAQVNEYKYEIEKLQRELSEMKRKYYNNKRKEQLLAELEDQNETGNQLMSKTAPQMLHQEQVLAAKAARSRFAGGGFSIK